MKKAVTALLVLARLVGGYLGVAHFSGGAFSTLGLALGGDRAALRKIALSFLEDIQFKDFVGAASYHAPDIRDSVDIAFIIQRLFTVRPEALDIMDYEVVFGRGRLGRSAGPGQIAREGKTPPERADRRAGAPTLLRTRQRRRSLVHEIGRQPPPALTGLGKTKLTEPAPVAASNGWCHVAHVPVCGGNTHHPQCSLQGLYTKAPRLVLVDGIPHHLKEPVDVVEAHQNHAIPVFLPSSDHWSRSSRVHDLTASRSNKRSHHLAIPGIRLASSVRPELHEIHQDDRTRTHAVSQALHRGRVGREGVEGLARSLAHHSDEHRY